MSLRTPLLSAALLVGLAVSPSAHADYAWTWSLAGTGANGSGTLTTAGDAATFEAITGISGTFNGLAIGSLVAPDTDPLYLYDQGFRYLDGTGELSLYGLLFDVPGLAHVNLGGYGEQNTYVIWTAPPGSPNYISFDHLHFEAAPIAAPVPEPSTWLLLALGLALTGVAGRRSRQH